MGPVASQEAIKSWAPTAAASSTPTAPTRSRTRRRSPTSCEMLLIFAIPAGLTYTYGRMARDTRQGWALFAAMGVLFLGGRAGRLLGRGAANPALASLALDRSGREHGGQGDPLRRSPASALFATVTTDASCGAVNAMHDSFTPLGGLVPAGEHPARRGHLRRRGRRPLRHAGLRRARRLHRRPDGGPHAGVPRQEDREPGDEAGDALHPHLPADHPRLRRLGGGRPVGHLVAEQRRAARPDARSSTPSPAAPATTARPSPASTPTRPGGTSRLGWRCSPAAS